MRVVLFFTRGATDTPHWLYPAQFNFKITHIYIWITSNIPLMGHANFITLSLTIISKNERISLSDTISEQIYPLINTLYFYIFWRNHQCKTGFKRLWGKWVFTQLSIIQWARTTLQMHLWGTIIVAQTTKQKKNYKCRKGAVKITHSLGLIRKIKYAFYLKSMLDCCSV